MIRSILLLAIASTLGAGLLAQPITIGETLRLPSRILGEERVLLVSTPPGYGRGSTRYPVLYLGDPTFSLTHTRGTVDFLVHNGIMPDMIVVGLQNTDRERDFYPTRATFVHEPTGRVVDYPTSGGADRFLDFLEKELFPYIEGRYRTQPFRMLAGHSSGGLFALHAFLSRPGIFHAAVAVSPHLAWDDELILKRAEGFFRDRKALPGQLYLAMANEEKGQPRPTRFERLCAILERARPEGFRWASRTLPEESHGSLVLEVHLWALRRIFEGWKPALDATGAYPGDADSLKAHYARFSQRLGCAFTPPAGVLNGIAHGISARGGGARARGILAYAVDLHPDDANLRDSLGEALLAEGSSAEALASFEKAVELGERTKHPAQGTFLRHRDDLAKRLADGRGAKAPSS